jgi:hypothetical protein
MLTDVAMAGKGKGKDGRKDGKGKDGKGKDGKGKGRSAGIHPGKSFRKCSWPFQLSAT